MKLHNEITALLESPHVRKAKLGDEQLYSVVDLLAQVVDRPDPAEHWDDLKRWEPTLASIVKPVKVLGQNGAWESVEMASAEQALRLLQSVNSKKAEKIRLWLAESGRVRLEETKDPELALRRARTLYENKGYTRDWIEKRLRGVGARHELTKQWYKRGATESDQYRQLTNDIIQGVFGMDVESFKRYKGLRGENLRDHMTDLELALTVLGETTASILHKERDSQGFEQLQNDVRDASQVAALTRLEIERQLGRSAATSDSGRKRVA